MPTPVDKRYKRASAGGAPAPRQPAARTALSRVRSRRTDETDVLASGRIGPDQDLLFTRVAPAARWGRHALARHPARRRVHAARTIEHLERAGPAPGEGPGGGARRRGGCPPGNPRRPL